MRIHKNRTGKFTRLPATEELLWSRSRFLICFAMFCLLNLWFSLYSDLYSLSIPLFLSPQQRNGWEFSLHGGYEGKRRGSTFLLRTVWRSHHVAVRTIWKEVSQIHWKRRSGKKATFSFENRKKSFACRDSPFRRETRPSRPMRCDVLIVERMRYRPTNRPTDRASYRDAFSHLKRKCSKNTIPWAIGLELF